MVRRIGNSVVRILISGEVAGSGFIVNAQGDVITNAHVVENVSNVTVQLQNGRSFPGEVIGLDEVLDLAYIRLRGGSGTFQAVTLGSSGQVSAGQDVLAVGYALGIDTPTVTRGIVSAVRTDSTGAEWIQTDAPVNPGNSGGPLLDTTGRVIGVVTSRLDYHWLSGRDVQGIGFALAVDELKGRMDFLAGGGQNFWPTPTPHPTGHWSTAKSYGSGDWQTVYIGIDGLGPGSPDADYRLTFRCDRGRDLQILVIIYYGEGDPMDYEPGWTIVGYGTGSTLEAARWKATNQSYSALNDWWDEPLSGSVGYRIFAETQASEDIAQSLRGGDSWLVIHEYLGEEYWEYQFSTQGFDDAAGPVFNHCDR